MSTAQEEIEEIKKAEQELKKEQEANWAKERELAERKAKIVASLILESKLLSKLKWKYTSSGTIDMIRGDSQHLGILAELARLADADYHHSSVLVPGDVTTGEENTTTFDAKVVLSFDDDDLYLKFGDKPSVSELMVEFIKSQNLEVDFGPLLRDYREAKRRVKDLENLVAFFGVEP